LNVVMLAGLKAALPLRLRLAMPSKAAPRCGRLLTVKRATKLLPEPPLPLGKVGMPRGSEALLAPSSSCRQDR
jgi:hypothetical protein